MRAPLLILALLLTWSCAAHVPPVVLVVPPVVVPAPTGTKPHVWTLPLEADNADRFCLQTTVPIYTPCWSVGYLRLLMVAKKVIF